MSWQDQLVPADDAATPQAIVPAWQKMLVPEQSTAQAKAVVNLNGSPDDAAKALAVSKRTGIDSSIVATDLPGYTDHEKQQTAIKATANPAIASYIDGNPMAPQVSSDDYDKLGEISPMISALGPEAFDAEVALRLAKQHPAVKEMNESQLARVSMQGILQRGQAGFNATIPAELEVDRMLKEARALGLGPTAETLLGSIGAIPAARAVEAAFRLPPALIGGASSIAAGVYERFTGSSANADRLERDLNILGTGLMTEAGMPKTPKAPRPSMGEVHTFLADQLKPKEATGKPTGEAVGLSAEATPESARWNSQLKIDEVMAETSKEWLTRAVDVSQESKTKKRSSELYADYIEAHGDKGIVNVPGQVLLDLYQKEGKLPTPDDGLFGFVPGITEKMVAAADAGADVAIPMSRYIANVDPALHGTIADTVRLENRGPSVAEVKARAEEKAARDAFIGPKMPDPVAQAAADAITKQKESLFLAPMFKEGAEVGLPQGEFGRYSRLIDKAQEDVLTRAVNVAKAEVSRRLKPEWKLQETAMRERVTEEVFNAPVWQADRFFNQGLMIDGKPVPKELRIKPGEDGFRPDDYASMFGYETGSAMMKDLIAHEEARTADGIGPKAQFKRAVDEQTAARMEAEHGNLSDNIALEASNVALASYNVDILSAEYKMLAKLDGDRPAPYTKEFVERGVKEQFNKSTASDVSYEQWRRAAEKQGREAEKALLKKDYTTAFEAKQRQLVAYTFAREAKAFEVEAAKAERLVQKYADDVSLSAVDQAYTDHVHRVLQQLGIETRRTIENTEYNLNREPLPNGKVNTLSNFIEYNNLNGAMIVEAPLPTPQFGAKVKPIDQLSVDQFRDINTMIKSLDHNGRAQKTVDLTNARETLNEAVDKITKSLDTMEKGKVDPVTKEFIPFDPDAKGFVPKLRNVGRWLDAKLLKMEKMIDWIDKNDPNGPMNTMVLRPLIEAEGKKADMISDRARAANLLPADKAWGRSLSDRVDNQILRDENGKLVKLTNENKIAIALNYGNEGNRKVLTEGHGWREAEVEQFLADHMTDTDWKMVNALHKLLEPLGPLVEEVTRKRAGVAVPLVEKTPFMKSEGGYWPLIEDSKSKLLNAEKDVDLFAKTNFNPLPTASALKQRTGKVYPLDLTIGRLNSIMSQTIHAVYMQDPVIQANKLLGDSTVREGVMKAFGPEYVGMMDTWLRDIARNGGLGESDRGAMMASRMLRENVVSMLMGWKLSTAMIHGGSAGLSSVFEFGKMKAEGKGAAGHLYGPVELVKNMKELGLGQFLPQAAARFFGSDTQMFDMMNFVRENSAEMRNRQKSLAKDFGYEMNKIVSQGKIDDALILRSQALHYSMSLVGYLDTLTATPVWHGAYGHALAKGLEHADAVYAADKAVREAHGSASLVSRANVGRGEISKWLTIAYNGYWNHNYNKMRESAVAGFKNPGDELTMGQRVAMGAAFTTAMIIGPALVHHAVRGNENETYGGMLASALVSQFGGTVPGVNTLTYSIMHNRDPSISPIETVLKSMVDVAKDEGKVVKNLSADLFGGDRVDPPKAPFKHAMQATGYLTMPLATNQLIDAFTFMTEVANGKQNPETLTEWGRGIMTGKSQPKKGH